MKQVKQILTLFFILIGIEILAQTAEPNFSLSAIESSKTWLDIDYAGDAIIGHKLDVFLPKKGKAPFPIIVTIYGSAWFSNSAKGSCFKDGFGQALLNQGFAVVSINHRSSADAIWPAQLHDIKAAVRFIRANATKFSFFLELSICNWKTRLFGKINAPRHLSCVSSTNLFDH